MSNIPALALAGAAVLSAAGNLSAQEILNSPPIVGEVNVSGATLAEETPDGAFGEPSWVRQRRFSLTRIYVQKDPGEIGVEEWWRTRFYDGGRVTQRLQTEVEIGLPYRMQLDIYEKNIHENDGSGWKQDEVSVELRYAFADWNVIPGNPTAYVEYAFAHDGPDALEAKFLLGGDFGPGWHWGGNLIVEHQLWGAETNEYAIAGGISKTLIDDKLSIGVESKAAWVRGDTTEVTLGPSLQWLPAENCHLDAVVLGGLTNSAPNAECWLIFGFDFGSGTKGGGYKPTNLGGN